MLTEKPLTASSPSTRLAGWMPASMLDWPGRIAATVFLSGCTLHCPFCHNPELAACGTGRDDDWAALLEHLAAKRSWLDGVVVTGGEPTDDPALMDLLAEFARIGVPVKLDTNGSRPDVLQTILERGLAEYVAMDVKTRFSRYGAATGCSWAGHSAAESAALLVDSGVAHEFRTTLYPGVVGLDELPAIARGLEGGRRYVLQQFRPDRTLDRRASQVRPYAAEDIRGSAAKCARWLPTTMRGVD